MYEFGKQEKFKTHIRVFYLEDSLIWSKFKIRVYKVLLKVAIRIKNLNALPHSRKNLIRIFILNLSLGKFLKKYL